ncbi:MAG TPA: VWA domain-containing protein, partial [Candidatus Limnocylindrales bacterium]|nr:VWA domain-containing protein [Candidatus Limnocylindrales bacterium]
ARAENAPGRRAGRGLSLEPGDFAVQETEELTRASTVLLVDMSRSMLLRGCFLAAKKVAVALDTLIRTQFPRDELHVIGFAYYAREIRPGALATLSWHGYEYGTNLQHGLMQARRILARSHGGNREIIVITDGEPTAHFEDGQVEFSYPPTRRTIQETLREVGRCTREGITINTFMLERSRALAEFVGRMTQLNRGRAFYATPERLGEYVLVDYVGRKTRRV